MDVLILNEPFVPGFCRSQRWAAVTRARVMRHPDGLATAAAVLRLKGFSVALVDGPASNLTPREVGPLVRRLSPKIVVLDSTTPSIDSDIATAHRIKNSFSSVGGVSSVGGFSSPFVIMVGPHASALPLETLATAGGAVDAVAVGEYELTLGEVAETLLPQNADGGDTKRKWDRLGPTIQGLALYNGGSPSLTRPRGLADFDDLPFPDYSGLDMSAYRDGVKLYPFMTISSSRGCPWGCEFCLWPQVMHGRKVRNRSIDSVIAEMKRCIDLFPSLRNGEFFFEDDTLTVDRDRTMALGRAIASALPGTKWSANSRADIDDPGYLRSLRATGLRMLLTGFESGDQGVLASMGKNLTLEKSASFARAAAEAGISVHGCFVLGYPGETLETIERTIRFALSLPIDTAQFSAAVPFPGTKMYARCAEEGLLPAESRETSPTRSLSAGGSNGEQRSGLELPGLSSREIDAKVDEALRRFYLRPGWALKFALRTRSLADLKRKALGARGLFDYFSGTGR